VTARIAAAVSGALLLIAAVAAWWIGPWITAGLVAAAVVVLSLWQWYRRRHDIPPVPDSMLTTYILPLTFGALAVVALNGWIYRISADAGGENGELGTIVGLITGVIGMAAAYGYGRIRAQKAQLAAVDDRPADHAEDELDPNEWLRNFNRENF